MKPVWRALDRRQLARGGAVLALFVLPFLAPLPPEWKRHRWLDYVFDLAHVPLLAAAAWALGRRGPLRGRWLAAAGAAMAVGVLIEALQAGVGRQMSARDLLLDAMGVGAVYGWERWRAGGRRAWLALAVALVLIVPGRLEIAGGLLVAERRAAARFPLLADFESRVEARMWRPTFGGRLQVRPREDGGRALALTGRPPQQYPGATVANFPRDWSGYRRLEWDARAVGTDSLRFVLRLDDFQGRRDDAWLGARFAAGRQWRHYAWEPAGRFGHRPNRPVRLDDLDGLTFYLARPESVWTLEIDNLRLTR